MRLLSGADFSGVANLTGSGAILVYQENRTLTGKTLNMDGSGSRLAIDGGTTLTFGNGKLSLFASTQNLQGSFANIVPGGRLTTGDGLGPFKVHYGPTSQFGLNNIVLTDYASAASSPGLGQFSAWTTTMGLPPDQANATDDPDRDGLPNAIEYALGLHPMQLQTQSQFSTPTVRTSATQPATLELSFRMANPQPPDVGLQIEASSSLAGPWQRIAWKSSSSTWCGASSAQGAPDAGQIPVTISDIQPINASALRFLRLRATINQP